MSHLKPYDHTYMRRALQLAAAGKGAVSPNPAVGAVIVAGDRIIGEGWHRRWGGPHAEVNAINSVAPDDIPLLAKATVYVTLEPCSHYGKTPPCAKLILDTGIPRIVVGAGDPNPLVAGRGLDMLRNAGREVVCGVLEKECMELNLPFFTSQTLRRPWVTLKFAQSADGFIGSPAGSPRLLVSSPESEVWVHRMRSLADAIFVGPATIAADNPRLDCRRWPGRKPLGVSFGSKRIPEDSEFMKHPHVLMDSDESLPEFLSRLFAGHGVGALLVEGGARTLQSFIDAGIYDEIRVETAPFRALSQGESAKGWTRKPRLPENLERADVTMCGDNTIETFRAPSLVKNS